LDNVIITPHIAAFDSQAIEEMAIDAARNILDLFAGKWPSASLINPEVKAAWRS
jgi:phosphoglycerate dehydrogenase-like enzyme